MIRTKQELEFYILADRMMNRGVFHYSLLSRIKKYSFLIMLCHSLNLCVKLSTIEENMA